MEYTHLPASLAMALARNPRAWNTYCAMTEDQQQAILTRGQNARTAQQTQQIVESLTR